MSMPTLRRPLAAEPLEARFQPSAPAAASAVAGALPLSVVDVPLYPGPTPTAPAAATASLSATGIPVVIGGQYLTAFDVPAGGVTGDLVAAPSARPKATVNRAPVAADDRFTTSTVLLAVSAPLTVRAPGVLSNDTDPDGDGLTATLVTAPARGVLLLAADGSFIYTPALGYSGTDTFTYRTSDGISASAPATVTITIGGANRAPTSGPFTYFAVEDTTLTVPAGGVLRNDVDPDGDTLSAVLDTPPAHGTLVLDADGAFRYTPAANWSGTDTFRYHATDGSLDAAPATVTVVVMPVNDAPTLDPLTNQAVAEHVGPLTVAFTGVSAGGGESQPLTVTATSSNPALLPAPTVTYTSPGTSGTLTLRPAAGATGSATITVTVSDGVATTSVTVTLTVLPVNDAPAAGNDSATTAEDTPVTVAVRANDTDDDGDALTVTAVGPAAHGAVTTNGATVTYTPAANWFGTDSFTYTVSDGNGGTATAAVTVVVSAVNDAPVARADAATTAEDTAVTVAVCANDADPDGDLLTVTAVGTAAHGTVTTDGATVVYTPAANWSGSDSFTYTVTDAGGLTASATVSVTVSPVNDAPTAADDLYTTPQSTPLTVPAAGVLANDADIDGDALAAELVAGPSDGTLSLNADGSFTYTPDAAFTGTDRFTYRASDGAAVSRLATVEVRVLLASGRPVAADDTYTVLGGTVLTVAAAGVLANDTPSGAAPLTAALVSGPDHGTLTLNADGSFVYTPAAGYVGLDTFTYTAADAGGTSELATVVVTVLRPNRAPVGEADALVTVSGTPVVLTAAAAMANDADPDGDAMNPVYAGGPAHGSVTVAADGSFTYTPAAGFSGTDTFTYRVTDGQLTSGPVLVTVTVSPAPPTDPPTTPTDPPTTVSPPTPADPPAPPVPPTVTPGPTVSTPPATPELPVPTAPTTPTVTVAFSATSTGDGFGPLGGGPAGTVSPAPTTPSGDSPSSPRTTDAPAVSDTGRVFGAVAAPAAPTPAPPEVVVAPPSLPPQPTPAPSDPSPPAVVLPPLPPTALAPTPAVAAAVPPATVILPDSLLEPLDRIRDELRAETADRATTDTIVVAGGVAVAGTVLLNTRAVFWFLGALLARPAVWRRFDPLDVVYAWERENARRPGPDDSLQSLVG